MTVIKTLVGCQEAPAPALFSLLSALVRSHSPCVVRAVLYWQHLLC